MINPNKIEDHLDEIMDKIEAQAKLISEIERMSKDDYTGKYEEMLEEANEKLLQLGEQYNAIEAEYIESDERFNILNNI